MRIQSYALCAWLSCIAFTASASTKAHVAADFHGANLTGTNFQKANLKNVNLSHTNLTNVNFKDADLLGANISGASWSNTICVDGTNSDSHSNGACPNNPYSCNAAGFSNARRDHQMRLLQQICKPKNGKSN
jgi:uncharacterized protein YjbI with pentapeptide repeats